MGIQTTPRDGPLAASEPEATLSSDAALYGGRYALESELGHGGMGQVFRARDLKLGRAVALKLLAPGAHDEEQRHRFEREARAAGSLDHPNIVVVHDVGEQRGEPYIVTELLEGETLRRILSRGPLGPAKALDLAAQLADGLAAAHARGIVHRDVKPENVFVTDRGQVKLLDFGIAKLLESPASDLRTDTGVIMGTPAYMSPEQIRGQPADARSDVFAFGAVMHEMLSGTAPFHRESTTETAYAILNDLPAALPASTPAVAARVIERCVEKDPAARWADAGELAVELRGRHRRLEQTLPIPRRFRLPLIAALCGLVGVALFGRWLRSSIGTGAGGPTPAIAVLPFVDMSPQKDQEYFSDGVAEEILNSLAQIEGLRVSGRTSSFSLKGKSDDLRSIGQKLNVSTVLEGSVRKEGNRVRVTAQLVSTADGFHLWSHTYDRELTGIFAVQDEIARGVVEALKIQLAPGWGSSAGIRTPSPDAYNEYLLGNQLYYRLNDARRARAAYERAVASDPGFAPAWAGLANATYWGGAWSGRREDVTLEWIWEQFDRSIAAAEKAVALGPELADGYSVRGYLRGAVGHDWKGAQTDLERALTLNPGDAETHRRYATIALASVGRLSEAIREAKKATDLDPLSAITWKTLALHSYSAGQLASAREAIEHALRVSPEPGSHHLTVILVLERRPAEALAAAERVADEGFRLQGKALALHDLGRLDEARGALESLIAGYSLTNAYQIAEVYAWFEARDHAFEWLDRAFAQRDTGLRGLKYDVTLRSLHGDPRFIVLLGKMNLPAD